MFGSVFASAITIFLIAFFLSLSTTSLNRKLANREEFGEWQEEIKRWNADKERAKKTGDKKLMAKLRKQEKRISQMQSKMFKGQMLSMLINIGLFLVAWQLLISYFGDSIVAYVPFAIPFVSEAPPYPLPFFYWYIICSFFSGALLSRISGVGMGMGAQPQKTG